MDTNKLLYSFIPLVDYKAILGMDGRVVNRELAPLRDRYDAIMADPPALDRILAQGAQKARPIAAATVKRLRKAAGIDW
jgi:hypothetical protein